MAIPTIEKFRIPLSRLFAIALLSLILLSDSKWEGTIVTVILFASGCFLVAIASLGRLWCNLYIGGYKTEAVITEGPYSMCRHPLYFFSFLGAIGVALATETMLIPLAVFLGFAIYYPYTMRSEEADLLKRYHDAYAVYRDSTPAFFPKPSLLREPVNYTVYTRVFRKHIFDALWFIWLVGIMEIIEAFHELGILPIIFHLY
ncbi:MAG: isoprenylcysteine carboxylmethyltransferase family protein [Deltaproteobacteria bacterium]|nr:isoprenylcysteine carboxylmethyltransferase family protein [Deltaproteobacteria bacterium]